MRILYFGLPLAACLLHREGHELAAIVLGHTDMPGVARTRKMSSKNTGVPMLYRPNLEDEGVLSCLESSRPDVILSWFYPRKLSRAVLNLAPRGAFGTHPSLLPRWRGPDPYHWAIRSGDAETGVTLHRLDSDYDTGHVIARRSLTIRPDDNAWTLARRLDRPALALLVEAAADLARGERLEGAPQDEAAATNAPLLTDSDYELDWQKTALELERFIRACAPTPGAYTELGDHVVTVTRAHVALGKVPKVLAPAEAWRSPEGVLIRCGEGGLVLDEVVTEDERTFRGASIAELL